MVRCRERNGLPPQVRRDGVDEGDHQPDDEVVPEPEGERLRLWMVKAVAGVAVFRAAFHVGLQEVPGQANLTGRCGVSRGPDR